MTVALVAALGDRLKELMAARGLTVPTLVERSGVPERYIRRYRNTDTEPKLRHLISLADALEVSLDELVGRTDAPASAPGKGPLPRQAAAPAPDFPEPPADIPDADEPPARTA